MSTAQEVFGAIAPPARVLERFNITQNEANEQLKNFWDDSAAVPTPFILFYIKGIISVSIDLGTTIQEGYTQILKRATATGMYKNDIKFSKKLISMCNNPNASIDVFNGHTFYYANININPEVFEHYVKETNLVSRDMMQHPTSIPRFILNFDRTNALINIDILAKHAPELFRKKVMWRYSDVLGIVTWHYLAEQDCEELIKHTPHHILEEILDRY